MDHNVYPIPGNVATPGDTLKLPGNAGAPYVDPIGTDIDPAGRMGVLVGGTENLQNAVLRRLRCRAGYLPHHPEYGSRLYEYVGQTLDLSMVIDIRDEVARTLKDDPRILDILQLSVTPNDDSVWVDAIVMTPLGPVQVTGGISPLEA